MMSDGELSKLASEYGEDFINTLNDFMMKINTLDEIKDSNPKLYEKINNMSIILSSTLRGYLALYLDGINKENLIKKTEQFSSDCAPIISAAKCIFQQHPSAWYALDSVIRGILGILSIIIVLPAVGIVGTRGLAGFQAIFFKKPKYDPHEVLKEFEQYIFSPDKNTLTSKGGFA